MHGGAAPQVRAKARARLTEVKLQTEFRRMLHEEERRARVLAPWAGDLRAYRFTAALKTDQEKALELRRMAAEMRRVASELTGEARTLERDAAQGSGQP